jgi:catechol 2,3-dioxygenase-like lactoylglutathione lyase family enzyme
MILSLHHIQLAMPKGRESEAVAFYSGVLGLNETLKPEALRGRGGVWFERGDVRVHLGVEDPFAPARKAHPAFAVADLDAVAARLDDLGLAWRRDIDLPGMRRLFIDDPFGNRIELLQPG